MIYYLIKNSIQIYYIDYIVCISLNVFHLYSINNKIIAISNVGSKLTKIWRDSGDEWELIEISDEWK